MDLWWPNIGKDCIFVVAHCKGCCIERTKFVAEPFLQSITKPRALLAGWSIDLIINIKPVFLEGYHHCIVAMNCLSNWIEVWRI